MTLKTTLLVVGAIFGGWCDRGDRFGAGGSAVAFAT